jgi:hypothetical protein
MALSHYRSLNSLSVLQFANGQFSLAARRHRHFYRMRIVVYGMKTIPRVTAPTENGEPVIGVSVPVLESRVNPAIS